MKSETENLKSEVDSLAQTVDIKTGENDLLAKVSEQNQANAKSLLADMVKKYNKLTKANRDRYVRNRLIKWRAPVFIMIFISCAILIMIGLALFNQNCQYNLLYNLFTHTDAQQSESIRTICIGLYSAAIIAILGYTSRLCFTRFNKKKVKAKKDELEREYKPEDNIDD